MVPTEKYAKERRQIICNDPCMPWDEGGQLGEMADDNTHCIKALCYCWKAGSPRQSFRKACFGQEEAQRSFRKHFVVRHFIDIRSIVGSDILIDGYQYEPLRTATVQMRLT